MTGARTSIGDDGDGGGTLRPYAGLFFLLCLATFFEGFDTKLSSLVLPLVRADFGVSIETMSSALGLSRLGMIAAFPVVLMADAIGRRPVFLAGLFGYAIFTLATAWADDVTTFTVLQFFASGAMVVELFLAYVILSEEIPASVRGRVNGVFASTAVLGSAVPAGFLAPLDAAGISWRGLFVIGAIPLLLVPVYVRWIPETRLFLARREADEPTRANPASSSPARAFVAQVRTLWQSDERARLLQVSGLWLAVNFWSGTALYFFSSFAMEDRGWTKADFAILPLGTIPIGITGYVLAGLAMDRIGRRHAAVVYLIGATVASVVCFQATDDRVIYAAYFALVGLGGVWTIVTTWTTELFRTATRATGLGVANNLIGRIGLVAGPIVAGALAARLGGFATAITALALTPLLALPLAIGLPETRGLELAEADAGRSDDGRTNPSAANGT